MYGVIWSDTDTAADANVDPRPIWKPEWHHPRRIKRILALMITASLLALLLGGFVVNTPV